MSRQDLDTIDGSIPLGQDIGRLFTIITLGLAALVMCLWFFRPGRGTHVPESVLQAARTAPPRETPAQSEPVTVQRPILPGPILPELQVSSLRPYTQWDVRETAIDSVGRIGSAAVPTLIETLDHESPRQRENAAKLLGRIGPDAANAVPALVWALEDPNEQVRIAAARALGQIGPSASSAVQPLLELLVDNAGNEEADSGVALRE